MRYFQKALCAVLALTVAVPASAMEFSKHPLPTGSVAIIASGDIQAGDDETLHRFVAGMSRSETIWGVVIDSRGGSLREGLRLASTIHASGLATIIPKNAVCASACFLMFAAGRTRFASDTARIGVHSASTGDGVDDTGAQASTTIMARVAAQYGVPGGVIGKMVTTLPGSIAWLTSADVTAMGVTILQSEPAAYQPGSSLVPGGSAPGPLNTPAVSPIAEATVADTAAYKDGRTARLTYEQWYTSLSGDLQLGALWWVENRKLAARDHLGCAMQQYTSEFRHGCASAQAMLTPVDVRRVREPNYKSGWNSL